MTEYGVCAQCGAESVHGMIDSGELIRDSFTWILYFCEEHLTEVTAMANRLTAVETGVTS